LTNSKLSGFFIKHNPAVSSHWHIALAGITWASVGLLLCRYSYGWLSHLQCDRALVFAFIGIAISILVYRYGMSQIARKNLQRLTAIRGKKCVFGFLSWKSYANVALMVTMGVMLRHSAVPKDYLSLVYTSMGGALLLGSSHYGKTLLNVLMNE
jgi:hypothetical protein